MIIVRTICCEIGIRYMPVTSEWSSAQAIKSLFHIIIVSMGMGMNIIINQK